MSKKSHCKKQFSIHNNDIKSTWNIIKEVTNTKLADSFLIAEKFSNFSTDFDLKLALKIPQSNNHCLKYINVASSLFQYITSFLYS